MSMKPDDPHFTRQVAILHLSDLHFGKTHRFNPPPTVPGDIPPREGYPTLLEKLSEDLKQPDPGCPVIVCLTGDFAETGDSKEFGDAERFIVGLRDSEVFGQKITQSSVFLVAGNHDVNYTEPQPRERLAAYAQLLSALTEKVHNPADPWHWPFLHDRIDDLGLVVLTLNSSIYVQKGKPDEARGHIDIKQLTALEEALKTIPPERLHGAIKVALIHHHPVLIPALAEPGRGYDAVHNSGKLLSILRKHGFHMILHGHKHDPHVFTEDSRSAFRTTSQHPILIAAGGSVGSTELPLNRANCYNRISIKWHPAAGQARIFVETVALSVFDEDGNEALPAHWKWTVLKSEDIHFLKGRCVPDSNVSVRATPRTEGELKDQDARPNEYVRLRGNMLSIDVRPSLKPNQGYEAVVWITAHEAHSPRELPLRVEWSAGPKFHAVVGITAEQDERFCAKFDYWGPMLMQAILSFPDGTKTTAFIYARIPQEMSH